VEIRSLKGLEKLFPSERLPEHGGREANTSNVNNDLLIDQARRNKRGYEK
jgi:hypothetical protein